MSPAKADCASNSALTVLAWDTSSPWCSLALIRYGPQGQAEPLGEFLSDQGTHSQMLAGRVREMLAGSSLTPADLDLVAVGRGPGSFTGLRTGLALAKGLGWGAGRPVVGLSSLEIAAYSVSLDLSEPGPGGLIAPVIDARHGQVFTALYQLEADGYPLKPVMSPQPVNPADLAAAILQAADGRPALLTGPALELVLSAHPGGLPAPLTAAPRPIPPLARALAGLACSLYRTDPKAPSHHPPIPMYLRQPDIRSSGLALR